MINDLTLETSNSKEVELCQTIEFYIRQFDVKDLEEMKRLAISLAQSKAEHYYFDEMAALS